MSAQRPTIPVLFYIDVEPDVRHLDPAAPSAWDGYEAAHRWLSTLRSELQDVSGEPVHYCWNFRMDAQIAEVYGSMGWVADRYQALIQAAAECGDEIGLHPHVHRWDRQAGTWVIDLTDDTWMEDVMRGGLEAFRVALGRPCRTVSLGAALTPRLIALADRSGVKFEISGTPGQYPYKRFETRGISRGRMTSHIRMPEAPYRPSRTNLLRPGSGDDASGLTMIPLTVAPLAFPRDAHGVLRCCRYAWKTRFLDWAPTILLYMAADRARPDSFADLLDRAIGSDVSHLAFVLRSDFGITGLDRVKSAMRYLIEHPRVRPVFTTPQELVDRVC